MDKNEKLQRLPPPEVVEAVLRQTSEQLEIRRQELALQKQADANSFEYAKLALQAQSSDIEKERQHDRTQTARRYVFGAFSLLVIVAFLGYCMSQGKEKFAEDVLKLLLGFLTGGASGYFYGKSKGSERVVERVSEPDDEP